MVYLISIATHGKGIEMVDYSGYEDLLIEKRDGIALLIYEPAGGLQRHGVCFA